MWSRREARFDEYRRRRGGSPHQCRSGAHGNFGNDQISDRLSEDWNTQKGRGSGDFGRRGVKVSRGENMVEAVTGLLLDEAVARRASLPGRMERLEISSELVKGD